MSEKTPIVLNDQNSQHVPLASTDTFPVSSIPLSTGSGQLLTKREDGLYYGLEAQADLSNLYVDPVAGDDTGPGTRLSPLKTLDAAIGKIRSNQSNTIWLRAGQTFYYKNTINVEGGATRVIRAYGDDYIDGNLVIAANTPEIPYYNGYNLENTNRPIIKPWLYYNETINIASCSTMQPANGGKLSIIGCILDAKPINDVDSGHESAQAWTSTWGRWNSAMLYGNGSGTVEFRSCVLRTPLCPTNTYAYEHRGDTAQEDLLWWSIVGSGADGSVASVQFNRCKWETGGSNVLLSMSAASCQLFATGWPVQPDAVSKLPGYEILAENITTRLKESKAISGLVRDSAGVPRNISSNIVL